MRKKKKKTIKMVLFTSYGSSAYTPEMGNILRKNPFPKNRTGELVEFVENKATDYENFSDTRDKLMNDPNCIVRVKEQKSTNKVDYLVWDSFLNSYRCFSIVEVNIARPWTIDEYDGAEGIVYLDENELVNEELNYWSRVGV